MSEHAPEPIKRDLISLFVRHRTAANLLMALMFLAGFVGLNQMNTQFFPNFNVDYVSVRVNWPGASATDVDENIVQSVEPEVRFLDGVKTVTSSSFEGSAVIIIEYEPGTDMQSALSDVETAVARVTTLPEESETPVIQALTFYETLSQVVISGPFTERALKEIAERMRDDLLDRGIAKVDIQGARDEEIWVEIQPDVLRQLGLTLDDVASRIRATSQDVPSGDIQGATQRQIRSLGMLRTARDVRDIEIRALDTGQKIYLRDIASVTEAFEEGGRTLRRNGQPAVQLHIQRAETGDSLALANIVEAYLAEARQTLPRNLDIEQYDIRADLIRSRVELLLNNGIQGLIIVLAVLFVFLNFRVAFWVALGIPISLAATMMVMLGTDQTINMVSLFGLIMAIGIVVDDAIVVGEHSETRFAMGDHPYIAAEQGARRMLAPVMSASLTTIAAFLPLLIISNIIGQIIQAIPLVIIAVIVASVVECFLVLPGHMRHALSGKKKKSRGFRLWFDRHFNHFRDNFFERLVRRAVEWRYATLAMTIAVLLLSLGLVMSGRVGFIFFPNPEVDNVFANVEFDAGSPRARTIEMLDEMERAMRAAERRLTSREGSLVEVSVQNIGQSVGQAQNQITIEGDNVGGLFVQLIPTDRRDIAAADFIEAWRQEVRRMPGLVNMSIRPAQGGPPGRDVDVRLSGGNIDALKAASEEVKALLRRIPGVFDIEDDLPYGKRETILELTPRGRALGFTTESVGRQVRNAFEGAIARRFPRDDEEVVIRVQYPRGAVDSDALHSLFLRSPSGNWVPLTAVVSIRESVGFARIRREDGRRQVAITGDIDGAVTNTSGVIETVEEAGIRDIAQRHGVTVGYKGRAEEQAETFADMILGVAIGWTIIYIVLAWVFSSYARPIVVMLIIPLGLIGTILGHAVLGYDLTILSLIAIIGLSGIVVNDSIILVTTINERIGAGEPFIEAIVNGSRDRLRAVILTSLTTVGGLTPLIFETDLQAQFLIPMAITLVFGLLAATLLVLVVIPSMIAIQRDLGLGLRRLLRLDLPVFGSRDTGAGE